MATRVVYELKITHRNGATLVDNLYLYWSDARAAMKETLADWQKVSPEYARDLEGRVTERILF